MGTDEIVIKSKFRQGTSEVVFVRDKDGKGAQIDRVRWLDRSFRREGTGLTETGHTHYRTYKGCCSTVHVGEDGKFRIVDPDASVPVEDTPAFPSLGAACEEAARRCVDLLVRSIAASGDLTRLPRQDA